MRGAFKTTALLLLFTLLLVGSAGPLISRVLAEVAAGVSVSPEADGRLAVAKEAAGFELTITNSGGGNDRYELARTQGNWPVAFYQADGVTPLADSNGNGTPDTGPVEPGKGAQVVVRVQAPAGVQAGDQQASVVSVTSARDKTKSVAVTLTVSVPPAFAQISSRWGERQVRVDVYAPDGHAQAGLDGTEIDDSDLAVAAGADGRLVLAWTELRTLTEYGLPVREIYTALVEPTGSVTRGRTRLADLSGVTQETFDSAPVLAVAPDGNAALLWIREADMAGEARYSAFFAVLDAAGALVHPPEEIASEANGAWLWDPSLAAAGDGSFRLAWARYGGDPRSTSPAGSLFTASRSSSGVPLAPPRDLSPTLGGSLAAPSLTASFGGRTLLAYENPGASSIGAAILGGDGSVQKRLAELPGGDAACADGRYPDVARLAGGRALVAWQTGGDAPAGICIALLDGDLGVVKAPALLHAPQAPQWDLGVSAAALPSGGAVLAWNGADADSSRYLYYALLAADGTLLGAPAISQSDPQRVYTSLYGYGITTASTWGEAVYIPAVMK